MTIFEKIIETNLINFLIVIFTLCWIVNKFSLNKIADKMANDIISAVEESESATKSVLNSYSKVKKSVTDTNKLKEEILNNTKISIENRTKIIKEETKTKKQDIIEKLNLSKNLDFERIKKQTTGEIFMASLHLAKYEIENILNSKDAQKFHKKITDNAIEELDSPEISKGANLC